ncbi:uncharacterized protein [Henckelia pumila]|uniref:uncharacterized protein n=1 Tax=Henckelia pumila TaxID=405737 RepID=UPI003C6E6E2C
MNEESVAAIGIASANPEIIIDSAKDTEIRIALNKKSGILNDFPEIEIDSSTMKDDAEFRIDTAILIDLGCSYSRVSVCLPDGGKLEIVPNVLGSTSTPCYVTFGENEYWVGEFDAALTNPKNTIFDSKRLMAESLMTLLYKMIGLLRWFQNQIMIIRR